MGIYDQLISILNRLYVTTDGATSDSRLKEDLDMDSTEVVELEVALEKHFGIHIEDATFSKLSTLGDVTDFIQASLEQKLAAGR